MKPGQWQVEIKVSCFPLNHPIPKTNPQLTRTSVFQWVLSKNQSNTSTILMWHIKRKLIKLVVFKCLLIRAQGAVALLINVNHFKFVLSQPYLEKHKQERRKKGKNRVTSPDHRETSSVLTYTRAGGGVPGRERRDGSCPRGFPALNSLGGSLARLF